MATQSFNKWVKATALALVLAVPALSQAAYYNSCEPSCNPCDPCPSFCDMDFKVGVDFIYWRPCVDDLEYATVDTFTTVAPIAQSTTINSVSPKWVPGFRVYLGVPGLCYDFDLTASYTWIYSGTTNTTASDTGIGALRLNPWLGGFNPTAVTAIPGFGAGRAHYSLHYNEWDVLFSYRISCNPCHSFVPHFGIAGIVTDSTFSGAYFLGQTSVTATDGLFRDTADYWGVGLRVGSDYEYKFSRCLTAFARAQGTILAGEAKNSSFSALPNTITAFPAGIANVITVNVVDNHKSCHIVPGYHLALGVQYDDKMCDMDVFFRVGYEFLNWWNMPNQRTFIHNQSSMGNSGTGPSTSASVRTLGFQGLFVGTGVSF